MEPAKALKWAVRCGASPMSRSLAAAWIFSQSALSGRAGRADRLAAGAAELPTTTAVMAATVSARRGTVKILDCRPVASGLEHTIRVQLRWRDMDMLGHLNQSVYHELIEEGRIALIADIMRRTREEVPPGGFVLAHVDLDYQAEVREDHGEVDIVVRVARVGASSIELKHEVRLPDGRLAASRKSILVAWDLTARSKRPLSEVERAALA